MPDVIRKFLFDGLPIRGEIIRLSNTVQAAFEHVDYAEPTQQLLGQAFAAAGLLSHTIKFAGRLNLQIQGDGPLSPIVVQSNQRLEMRGMAHGQPGQVTDNSLKALCGTGHMSITLTPDAAHDKQYQGIVPLTSTNLADTLEHYFATSEQLPTRLWLAANHNSAAGLLLQRLPGELPDQDAWERVVKLAETITDNELLSLPAEILLQRLYHQETVRLFAENPVTFKCTCSRARVADMLRGLGKQDLQELIAAEGQASVSCEFCGKEEVFDAIDAHQLFVINSPLVGSTHSH